MQNQGHHLTFQSLEEKFQKLTEVTDRVALINSEYDSDIETSIITLLSVIEEVKNMIIDIEKNSDERHSKCYFSHLSFHREVMAEIISEARILLISERREYLKRLVSYYKSFCFWFDISYKKIKVRNAK